MTKEDYTYIMEGFYEEMQSAPKERIEAIKIAIEEIKKILKTKKA